jgi:hypothetical protein
MFLNILYSRYEINLNEVQSSISGYFFSFLVYTCVGMYVRNHCDGGIEIKATDHAHFQVDVRWNIYKY